jgi:hypothetical protein
LRLENVFAVDAWQNIVRPASRVFSKKVEKQNWKDDQLNIAQYHGGNLQNLPETIIISVKNQKRQNKFLLLKLPKIMSFVEYFKEGKILF